MEVRKYIQVVTLSLIFSCSQRDDVNQESHTQVQPVVIPNEYVIQTFNAEQTQKVIESLTSKKVEWQIEWIRPLGSENGITSTGTCTHVLATQMIIKSMHPNFKKLISNIEEIKSIEPEYVVSAFENVEAIKKGLKRAKNEEDFETIVDYTGILIHHLKNTTKNKVNHWEYQRLLKDRFYALSELQQFKLIVEEGSNWQDDKPTPVLVEVLNFYWEALWEIDEEGALQFEDHYFSLKWTSNTTLAKNIRNRQKQQQLMGHKPSIYQKLEALISEKKFNQAVHVLLKKVSNENIKTLQLRIWIDQLAKNQIEMRANEIVMILSEVQKNIIPELEHKMSTILSTMPVPSNSKLKTQFFELLTYYQELATLDQGLRPILEHQIMNYFKDSELGKRLRDQYYPVTLADLHPKHTAVSTTALEISDPLAATQWALKGEGAFVQNGRQYIKKNSDDLIENNASIRADVAYQLLRDAELNLLPTPIAIVDTGIDFTHPDLEKSYWWIPNEDESDVITGYDFIINKPLDAKGWDDHGHGTHVAGIAAAPINGIGIQGISPNSPLMALRVLNKDGIGKSTGVIQAVNWALQHRAKIINLSLGQGVYSKLADKLFQCASNKALVIAAAGNFGGIQFNYPSDYGRVISVAAHDYVGKLADFSSKSPEIDISAPGVQITSTMGEIPLSKLPTASRLYFPFEPNKTPYVPLNGTSMATPVIAGAAALIWSAFPDLSLNEMQALILSSYDGDFPKFDLSLAVRIATGGKEKRKQFDWSGGSRLFFHRYSQLQPETHLIQKPLVLLNTGDFFDHVSLQIQNQKFTWENVRPGDELKVNFKVENYEQQQIDQFTYYQANIAHTFGEEQYKIGVLFDRYQYLFDPSNQELSYAVTHPFHLSEQILSADWGVFLKNLTPNTEVGVSIQNTPGLTTKKVYFSFFDLKKSEVPSKQISFKQLFYNPQYVTIRDKKINAKKELVFWYMGDEINDEIHPLYKIPGRRLVSLDESGELTAFSPNEVGNVQKIFGLNQNVIVASAKKIDWYDENLHLFHSKNIPTAYLVENCGEDMVVAQTFPNYTHLGIIDTNGSELLSKVLPGKIVKSVSCSNFGIMLNMVEDLSPYSDGHAQFFDKSGDLVWEESLAHRNLKMPARIFNQQDVPLVAQNYAWNQVNVYKVDGTLVAKLVAPYQWIEDTFLHQIMWHEGHYWVFEASGGVHVFTPDGIWVKKVDLTANIWEVPLLKDKNIWTITAFGLKKVTSF